MGALAGPGTMDRSISTGDGSPVWDSRMGCNRCLLFRSAVCISEESLGSARVDASPGSHGTPDLPGFVRHGDWTVPGIGPAGPAYLAAQNTAANIRLGTSLAAIAATSIARFMSGGGAGSAASAGTGGGGGVAVATPAQQTLTPITGESIDTTGVVQPVQAYVIGQDITNQQALDSELRLRSTL